MPKRVSPLSARAIDSLKEGQERADGALPGLRVRNVSGELVWSLFIVPPKAATKRRFEIGRGLTLGQAREKAVELRRRVREGKDPTTERKTSKRRALAARDGVGTLEAVVDMYYDRGPGGALRTGKEQSKTIKRVFKSLLKRVAIEVLRADIQLQADNYRSATSASAAIGALRPAMKWAAKRGLVKDDSWRDLERPETVANSSKTGRRRLSGDELAKLWPKLEGPYAEASKFLLYTASRLREGTLATWSEIDFERGTWTIAASRRKDTRSKRRVRADPAADLVIPLPHQALALLSTIHERRKPKPTDLVFVGPEGGELNNWSRWLAKLHVTSGVSPWSAHALRRTAATMAAELGAEPHIVEAILGHRAIGNALQSVYQHSRYLSEHASVLQALADRIDAIVTGKDNVVRLRHAR